MDYMDWPDMACVCWWAGVSACCWVWVSVCSYAFITAALNCSRDSLVQGKQMSL